MVNRRPHSANRRVSLAASPTPSDSIYGSSVVSSRTGFVSSLPEFGGNAAPEQEDTAPLSLQFVESGGTVSSGTLTMGRPVWIQSTDLSGTYNPSTGALSVTGTCGALVVAISATYGSAVTGTITVTNGAHEETRTFSCTFGTAVSLPTGTVYYLDSVNGNDGNAGTGPDVPFQTLGALPALIDGDRVFLARGSRWRERVQNTDLATCTATIIESYGCGPRPIVDAFDLCGPTWTLVGGTTNVYQQSVTPADDHAVNGYVNPLEDGVPLEPVANAATCDSTPGSFVITPHTGATTYTLQIHPRASTNPNSDGKTYEYSSRDSLYVEEPGEARGLHLRGANGHAGVLTISQDAAGTCVVDDIVTQYGAIHNLSITSVGMTRCMDLWCLGQGATENINSTVLNRNPGGGHHFIVHDCGTIDLNVYEPAGSHSGHEFYTTSVTIEYSECGFAMGRSTYVTFDDTEIASVSMTDCLFEPSGGVAPAAANSFAASARPCTIQRCRFYDHFTSVSRRSVNVSAAVTVEDCISTVQAQNNIFALYANGNLTDHRNLVYNPNAGVYPHRIDAAVAGDVGCTVNESMSVGISQHVRMDQTGSMTAADYNVVYPGTTQVQESPGASLRAFTVYQGDQGVLDQNSVTTAPAWEVGTDSGSRPTFIETAASEASRGFACGPIPSRPGSSVSWVTPPTYAAWYTFIASL